MKKLIAALLILNLVFALACAESPAPEATEVPPLFRQEMPSVSETTEEPTASPEPTPTPKATEIAPLFRPEATPAAIPEAADAATDKTQEAAEDEPKATEVPPLFADITTGDATIDVETTAKEVAAYKVGNRFLKLEHIYSISEAFDGTADILFETVSDPDRTNPGMLMIYKYAKGDAFPTMSITFCGDPDKDHDIERVVLVTDHDIYRLDSGDYTACQQNDEFRTYLFADGGNILMNRENAKALGEFLDSENGAIVVGNRLPYLIYTLTEEERSLLTAVVEEWNEIWNDEWYDTLDEGSRKILENTFPTLKASPRDEDDLITQIDDLYYEPYPELNRKDRGDDVITLQTALDKLGYDIGNIDGVFGENTENALRAFQELMGIDPTGIADDITQRKLYKIIDEGPVEEVFKEAEPQQKTIELSNVEVYLLDIAPDEERAVIEAREIEIAPDEELTKE